MIAVEARKVGAFLRRDLLTSLSYRTAFVADAVALVGQTLVFAFVGRLVDPSRLPAVGGRETGYLGYVSVGLALTAFLQVGLGRLNSAIGGERYLGTLESLLVTPTSLTTLQAGWVAYDVVYVPIRTLLFLAIVSLGFGVGFETAGLGPTVAFVVVFLPFVWGVGLLSAAATLIFRRAAVASGAISFALSFASGAYFPLEMLPRPVALLAAWNPLAVAIDGTRKALIGGEGWWSLAPNIMAVAIGSVIAFTVGSRVFGVAFRRELRNGAVGLY